MSAMMLVISAFAVLVFSFMVVLRISFSLYTLSYTL
jgi:hypothetical protein